MWFNSIDFLCFILIVLPIFWLLGLYPKARAKLRILFLLISSYVFYMWWNPFYILLIVASTVLDYCCGLGFRRATQRKKRWLLGISLAGNLGILGFFKYGSFAYESVRTALSSVGPALPPLGSSWSFALPVGISFYTFQTLSYTIDLYRGRIQVETNFLRFALFVSYFPQLVAGPIERARNLLGEIRRASESARPVDRLNAVHQIAYGLFKKVAVADNLALIVDPIFAAPGDYSGAMILMCTVFFAFQIYCDFSGYSDIAIGISELFGIRLSVNFLFPYFTTNVRTFWRTWHISLSSWLREYVYISLGGNRSGSLRTYSNVLTTMLLGGLWHGASWNFVLWGFLHGLYLIVHRLIVRFVPQQPRPLHLVDVPVVLLKGLFTFALVCLTWIPFRCLSFQDSVTSLRQIFTWAGGIGAEGMSEGQIPLCAFLIASLLALDTFAKWDLERGVDWIWPNYVRSLLVPVLVLLTIVAVAPEAQQFIYFQF